MKERPDRSDPRLIRRLSIFASTSAGFSAAVGLSGLAGWKLHIRGLVTWGEAPATMTANAAACFLLLGVSLGLLKIIEDSPSFAWAKKFMAEAAAAIVGLIGLVSLVEHSAGLDLGIDQFLFVAPPDMGTASVRPGLMSPLSAGAFLLLALALLGLDWRTRQGRRPAQFLSLIASCGAMFGLLSFAFDPHIYASHLSLSLPTAVTLLYFSLGVVCSRTDWGVGALLCSQSLGGSLARRLLPAAFIPALVGWARWQITATGLYSEWSIVVMSSLTSMSLLAGIIAWAAVAVDRNDAERRRIEEALLVSKEQLNRLLDRIDETPTLAPLRNKISLAFVAAVLLTCFLGLSSWRNVRKSEEDAQWVSHTQEVMKTLQATVRHLMEVETGARGFALSGYNPVLQSYETGRPAIGPDLNALRQLTADNPRQQERLDVLGPQVTAKIEANDALVLARRQSGATPTVQQLDQGKRLLDAARATLQRMEIEEETLLEQRSQKTRDSWRWTISVLGVGSFLGISFLVMAGLAIYRQIVANERSNALNLELNRQLRQYTTALQAEVAESQRVNQARERLAAIVDSSDDAIISKDMNGTITAWNRGAEKVFGYAATEAVGQPLLMLMPPERVHEEPDILARIGCGESVEHFETVRVRKDGTSIDVSVTISPIRDKSGAIIGASKIARDITDRKRAEEAFRDSEDRFQALANGIPQLAWMAEADGSIFWYNQRWYDYTGTTLEQMQGWGWERVHDPEMLPKVMERWLGSIASGQPFDMELPLRGADGQFRLFLTRVMPFKDTDGRLVRWFGTNTDISERKQAADRLATQAGELVLQAESLARSRRDLETQTRMLKLVLESMGEGLIAADREGRFLIWNDAARNLMGRDASDLPSDQWTPYYGVFLPDGTTPCPPDCLPLVRALRGESVHVELVVENPDREGGVCMEVTARPMKDAEGKVCGGVAVLHDITERKRAEADLAGQAEELSRQTDELLRSQQALEAQTRMLKLVLDSMGEGLVAADRKGRFIIWNDAAKKLMGQDATDLPNEQWTSHYKMYLGDGVTPYPTDDLPLVRALRGESVQVEMMIQQVENEPGVFLEVTARPVKDDLGSLCGGVVAFRDVTGRKAAEREIQQLTRDLETRVIERTAELQTANQDLEAFTYSVSHDLRAPLRHISGFAKILAEDFGPTLPAAALKHVQRIEQGADRMGQLVDELLDLARLGRQALTTQVTGLNAVVQDILTMLEPESAGRQVEWKIADLPIVECDPILIRQVFQNLIGNALKYSRPRSPAVIEIGQMEKEGETVIFVRDNGVGFSMKYADKLFGVFQRLHRAEEFEGTGVGLATVKRIVQKHGGAIWAEAALDQGSTFYFTLGRGEHSASENAAAAAGG
jgi:PAS domain S-box-containing protein